MSINVETVAIRTGATADWATGAPTLDTGEVGVDTTTRELKVGDGSTAFVDLPSLTPVKTQAILVAGTKIVADTKIKAGSSIIPVVETLGTVTTPKDIRVSRTPGTSYTLTSADNTDTSTVNVYVWH